jgi:hypothetical protein
MGYDVAGQCAALRAALERERPTWAVDQMARLRKRYAYPQQHGWSHNLARHMYQRADVVHLTETLLAREMFGPQRTVLHHHGSRYRDNREAVDAAIRDAGAVAVASTLDLIGPEVGWLPVVADLDRLARIRAEEFRSSDVVRIAHSPTDPEVKGTARLVAAVDDLRAAGLAVELDVITGVPWDECLRRKARADVFVDQLDLGYGLSAVEAWGMGLPVVAGVSDPIVRERMLGTFGQIPFAEGLSALGPMVADPGVRGEWAERGRAHVERFHSEAAVVDRLAPIYAELAA